MTEPAEEKEKALKEAERLLFKEDLSLLPEAREKLDGGSWGKNLQKYEDRINNEMLDPKKKPAVFEATLHGWQAGISAGIQRYRKTKDKIEEFKAMMATRKTD